jgi:hypothetical protein
MQVKVKKVCKIFNEHQGVLQLNDDFIVKKER